jgi:hypothetical protein
MSKEKSALDAMLEQYEKNNAPRFEKKNDKVYDLANYFNTYIEKEIKSATKEIRILPSPDGSPFVELHGHKIQLDGQWKTFPCLKHMKDEACPFCEAREALLATGEASDKELAKKYNARKMYVVKVIDRNAEEEGVKFWRFNHDYRKEGIFDKIHGVLTALKTNRNITDTESGRDLAINIQRNQNGIPVVSSIVSQDSGLLTDDSVKKEEWLNDVRTWEDVYSIRTYDYLKIVVKGGFPIWDKDENGFVDRDAEKEVSPEEDEITMGIDNVKSNIQASTTTEGTSTDSKLEEKKDSKEDDDDLPF